MLVNWVLSLNENFLLIEPVDCFSVRSVDNFSIVRVDSDAQVK